MSDRAADELAHLMSLGRNKLSVREDGKPLLYARFSSRADGDRHDGVLLGAPDAQPHRHAHVFAEGENLVVLATDETKLRGTPERHIGKHAVPCAKVWSWLERAAPDLEAIIPAVIRAHVRLFPRNELDRYRLLVGPPLNCDTALEGFQVSRSKGVIVSTESLHQSARIVPGAEWHPDEMALLLARQATTDYVVAPWFVVGIPGDTHVAVGPVEALGLLVQQVASVMGPGAAELMRSLGLDGDLPDLHELGAELVRFLYWSPAFFMSPSHPPTGQLPDGAANREREG